MTANLHKRAENFAETEIDEEVVLMDLGNGDFFSLTGSALAIWQLIDGTRDRAAILAALCEDYDADGETIAPDLDQFLAQAGAAGFVVEA